MVTHSAERANPGSSLGKFRITFEKQPPSQVRPGARFTMPVVVKVEPKEPQEADPTLGLRLYVELENEDGSLADPSILSENKVEVPYDEDRDAMKGRVVFDGLRITRPGRYLLCVILEIVDIEPNTVEERQHAASDVIVDVNDTAPQDEIPSEENISLFEALFNIRQPGISRDDIRRWRALRQ